MANVVRLVNGGTIQVRTGVIQGIGPQGPRGVAGPQGIDGPQGPVGEVGPMGQINQLATQTRVATNNPVTANNNTVIAFGSVGYDDMSCVKSTSNVTFDTEGDYLLSAWLRFDAGSAGTREMWFQTSGGTMIARRSMSAGTEIAYVDLSFPVRVMSTVFPAPLTVNVLARSSTATAISDGAWNITRVGSGPQGAVGPVGPVGPVGATGAAGPAGPSGTANSGFAKYADLLPH